MARRVRRWERRSTARGFAGFSRWSLHAPWPSPMAHRARVGSVVERDRRHPVARRNRWGCVALGGSSHRVLKRVETPVGPIPLGDDQAEAPMAGDDLPARTVSPPRPPVAVPYLLKRRGAGWRADSSLASPAVVIAYSTGTRAEFGGARYPPPAARSAARRTAAASSSKPTGPSAIAWTLARERERNPGPSTAARWAIQNVH